MFFGGGNAGSIRAEKFRRLSEETGDPQKALGQLINGSGANQRFIAVRDL
jgi:patatin-like phospholipase/acyl hydrolase